MRVPHAVVRTVLAFHAVIFAIGVVNPAARASAEAHERAACRPQLSGMSLPAEQVHAGAAANGIVRLSCAPHRATTVALTSGDPSWVTVPETVTVPAGAAEVGFVAQTQQPDYIYGELSVAITAALGKGTVSQSIILKPGLKYIVTDSHVLSGDRFDLQLGLNGTAPQGGITVTLESDNDAVQLPPSITIPAGSLGVAGLYGRTTRLPVDAEVKITAKLPGQTKTAVIALGAWTYDAGAWSLSGPESMHGTNGFAAQMTLDLQNPVPRGGVEVSLTSDNPKVTVPQSLTLPEGATTADFYAFTSNDIEDVATITATIDGVGSRTHQIRVLPGLKQFDGIPFTVTGGESFEMTVHLGTTTSQDLVVRLESDNPVLQVPVEVVVPAGQSSAGFTATTTQVEDFQVADLTARLDNTFISEYVFIDR